MSRQKNGLLDLTTVSQKHVLHAFVLLVGECSSEQNRAVKVIEAADSLNEETDFQSSHKKAQNSGSFKYLRMRIKFFSFPFCAGTDTNV
jgi:hypothetical protein